MKLPVIPLEIVRGSSPTFNISLTDPGGNVYVLAEGEKLRFGVKLSVGEPEYRIEKVVTASDRKNGVYPVVFKSSDTEDMPIGTYVYDVGLQPAEADRYYPVVGASTFTITRNVTRREADA